MKKTLLLCLIYCPFLALFSSQSVADDSETPKYTDEQLQKLKAAEEQYKDNPKVLELINNIKTNAGITDAPAAPPAPAPITAHGKVITQGSYQEAEAAFRNKDNETAIAHYKVLAAEGDPEASLKLGYIYEQEGDTRAAYAAYKNAAESEHDTKDSKMASERLKWLEKDVMSDEEINQANELAENPQKGSDNANAAVQKQAGASKSVTTGDRTQYKSIASPAADVATSQANKFANYHDSPPSRTVKVSPQRIRKTQHFEAEKFSRALSNQGK